MDGLRQSWLVHVHHDASIKTLSDCLPPLLLDAQARSEGDEQRARRLLQDRCALVSYASPLRDRPPGDVVVRSAGFSHSYSTDELSGWIDHFFARRHRDVAHKMSADGREEQHAFVWVTLESGPEQASIAGQRGTPFLPLLGEPPLPSGITHLWLAGTGTADRATAWFPDRGWHEVSTHWTETPTGRAILNAAGRSLLHP